MGKRSFSASMRIAGGQLVHMLTRVDFWIVIVSLAALFSVYLDSVRRTLAAAGEAVGVFAVFPMLMQNRDMMLMTLVAYLLLASDMPDFRDGMEQQVLRVRRSLWYASQWIYMAMLTVGYFLLVNLAAILPLLPRVGLMAGWGEGVLDGTIGNASYPASVALTFLAGSAAGEWAMLLSLAILLALFLSGVCCVCNLLNLHKGVGVLIDALLIFLWLLYDHGSLALGLVSPVEAIARYAGTGAREFLGYGAYYVILCVVVSAVGYLGLSRADIRAEC